jgi:flagellar basal body rod protein FlgG
MGNIKLLIVDDHPFIRDGLRSALKRQANLIVLGEASNGSEAVKLARDFAPDLVVMDIYMPIMNGHEATRQIMRMLPDTKIIILSGDISGFGINPLGVITEWVSDGSDFVRGQVLLQACSNPGALTPDAFDLSPIDTNSGLWSPIAAPFTTNLGWLTQYALEANQLNTNLLQVRSNLILNFFEQGIWQITDLPANLYLWGPGFFTVRDPVANILYATRIGDFQLDANAHLVTSNGLRVQGINNVNFTEVGDITIDAADFSNPTATVTNFDIDYQGNIAVALSDGTSYLRGQILTQEYRNIQGLSVAGNGLYSNLTAALPVFTNLPADYIPENTFMSGAVEQPNTVPPLQLPPASGVRLYISNYNGGIVQSSPDLQNWTPVNPVNYSVMNEAELFDVTPSTQKFYRVALPTWSTTNIYPLTNTQPVVVLQGL